MKKAIDLASKLKIIIICESDSINGVPNNIFGYWLGGNTIRVNTDKANAYTILHEIGHILIGRSCCDEHTEYLAHGYALGMSKVLKIELEDADKNCINIWSGKSKCKHQTGLLRKLF